MPQVGREKILRNIEKDHIHVCLKPCGIPSIYLEKIELDSVEMEAISLSDFECLYQQECTDKMGISCTAFSELIESAHKNCRYLAPSQRHPYDNM